MNIKTRLIYKSLSTCFQTYLPVYFYGTSDGRMIVLFTRFKTNDPRDTTQEWVLALHLDFSYDYESNTVLTNSFEKIGIEEFMELTDNLEQRIKILKTFGGFSTNTEALQYFNVNVFQMLNNLKPLKEAINGYYTEWQL